MLAADDTGSGCGNRSGGMDPSGHVARTPGGAYAAASRRHLNAALSALRDVDPAQPGARHLAMAELSDAIRCQDAFLHAAAHDLRNPLAAVRGQAQLLRRRIRRVGVSDSDAARFDEGLANLEDAVSRMASLIDQLLDASWQVEERELGRLSDPTAEPYEVGGASVRRGITGPATPV